MCGRATLTVSVDDIRDVFEVDEVPPLPPRFNIAPSQPVAAVRLNAQGERESVAMKWGIVPRHNPKQLIINARAETAATGVFKTSFARRRCAIPADGWYEFEDSGGKKLPWLYAFGNHAPFLFAGMWESGVDAYGSAIDCCTIVTVPANDLAAKVHDRMPAILDDDAVAPWLGGEPDTATLKSFLKPFPSERLTARRVSPLVNNWRNEGPELLAPS